MRQFLVTGNHTLHLSPGVRRRRTSALGDRGPDTEPTTSQVNTRRVRGRPINRSEAEVDSRGTCEACTVVTHPDVSDKTSQRSWKSATR